MSDTNWIVLTPRRGKRPEASARVTLAWRTSVKSETTRSLTGYVNVAKMVMEKLGWESSGRVEVAHDPAGTMLRVRLAETGYRIGVTNGCGTFQAYLPWVTCDKQPAQPVEFRAEGGVLLLTLPEWARKPAPQPPAPRPAIPLVEPRPAPKPTTKPGRWGKEAQSTPKPLDADPDDVLAALPADEREEARAMMRRPATGAKALAEHFGWEHERAVKIAAALRDEIALAARGAA